VHHSTYQRALEGISRSLAKELGARGTTVNLVKLPTNVELPNYKTVEEFFTSCRSAFITGQALIANEAVKSGRELSEKICVVTGGAGLIGSATVQRLAAEGATVVIVDIPQMESRADALVGNNISFIGGDLTNESDRKNLLEEIRSKHGRIDVLINNAGILRDRMLMNMTEQEWDDVIKVHLKGTFAPTHHAVQLWRAKNKETGEPVNGRVINTSSVSGLFGNTGQTNYGAAKAGIAAFTIIAARELARMGVTVNAISPSAVTRMTEDLRERTEQERAAGDPKWIAPVATYLASAEASDITGRIFHAGGGNFSVMEGWHHGPNCAPYADPVELGPVLRKMAKEARRNADMMGNDLD
ncbi:MAG: SDR family oxidoreductase, partial [Caldilineaceae bacterium]|nr:SDR family oxidoreductase [Caldilineaceae bacterium]